MKRLITTLLILSSLAGGAQSYQNLTNPGMTGRIRGNWLQDSAQFFNLTVKPTVPTYFQSKGGFIVVGDSVFRWSPSAHNWVAMTSVGSPVWGTITGTLSSQTDLQAVLNAKQNKLPAGTTSQYYDGTLALRNFRSEVNAALDTNYLATRGRLYKVIDSLSGGIAEVDPFRSVSATVVQATPYSKLLTINRADGTSFTASWGDTSLAAITDSIGWYAKGPYLQKISGGSGVVRSMDTAEVSEAALRALIESYQGDGSIVGMPDVTIDSFVITGDAWKTVHLYYASGRVDTAGFFDRSGPNGTGPEVYTPYVVTYSATPAFNYTNSVNQEITLTGNATISFSNIPDGKILYLLIKQDATGGRTVTWPAGSKIVGGSLTLTTTASAWDLIGVKRWGSNYLITYGKDFK